MVLEQEIVGSSTSAFSALAPFGRRTRKFTETLSGLAQAGIQRKIRQVWDRRTHRTGIFRRAVDADQTTLVNRRGNGQSLRDSLRELLVQRNVALTARLAGAEPQVPEALDETDDDREERDDRVETSETIESGDDADEVERAKDDRRATAW
ncbi:hypothetical protein N7472_006959 [Penicillium cf. griseofulvum]|uniref:Uncharacterized protein n=1 Tax=Penicillium cf. griseofulvum TaxID=2972120 RepID=A0A9W9JCX7_9EURO|nr:hypothetical protein N7472_006959 [Penicillium cf. griseofulvum]